MEHSKNTIPCFSLPVCKATQGLAPTFQERNG